MGIQGLLPQLKSIMSPIHVQELRGQTVAVDTYSWLHKGALSCSDRLCKGLPTSKHINYCMHRVNLLRHHGVKPILVFDGGFLPMKLDQENKRSRARKENLERALKHEESGNSAAAFDCYQKAVDISPSIALTLIQVLKEENVEYIVAPYEADAQMTFLSVNKYVDAVITEDSDLIPFGCSRIIFKMDKFGNGVEFQSSKLKYNKELDLTGFTRQMLLEMCIFSGCDYLQSLPGMGLKRAHALVQKLKSYEKVIKHLRYSAVSVPPLYEETFKKALWAFLHQRVYDPSKEDIVHLSEVPHCIDQDLDFLGPWLSQSVAKGIATGNLDPLTKLPFQGKETCTEMMLEKTHSIKEFGTTNGRKRMDLPVQKNLLTNYFCLASLEAKRKFRAPKVISKHLEIGNSSSPSSENHDSESPSSAEEAVNCTIKHTPDSIPDSKRFEDEFQSEPEDSSSYNSKAVMGLPLHGKSNSSELRCALPESKIEPLEPFMATQKKNDCNSALPALGGNIKTVNKKVIVRSKYFQHKLLDENALEKKNEESIADKNTHVPLGDSVLYNGDSFEKTHQKDSTKRRKLNLAHPAHRGHVQLNDVHRTPVLEEGCLNKKGVDMEVEENLGCNISHLNEYSGIAEKSMDKFVSLISSFRYTSSGSRASGLRAPLKDVQNTCTISVGGRSTAASTDIKRSTTTPIDFNKYRYTPSSKKTL